MSHMSNYGSDRLALYTFESVFQFIRCWTNLKLVSSGPLELAEKYFKLYPEEIDPIWGVSLKYEILNILNIQTVCLIFLLKLFLESLLGSKTS